jgi:hypothetical protein
MPTSVSGLDTARWNAKFLEFRLEFGVFESDGRVIEFLVVEDVSRDNSA